MTVMFKPALKIKQVVKARAEAKGIPLEDCLPSLLAEAVQQEDWAEDDASLATVMGSGATMDRIWDTPEEDAAWKYLEDL